ncbi:hypothetical protein [Pseudomarimonas salicorniae]|uniref:Major facilitator superfamily (MFS) profile domain-containing protein n=1 Tax=Pseudomarimonas salicorniae TaxID=2933270 RepID=A0ABT0GKC8_9GAMM|nr:hypothetical protein [Lysobacter sp. CAU 1642]MCK7594985.1 hypothetical protein [Lysobacter sp. CAU 1642]
MSESERPGRQLSLVLAWLFGGGTLGYVMALGLAPGSDAALVASVLMLPMAIFLGWLLMFGVAFLWAPFVLLGWLRRGGPKADRAEEAARGEQRLRRLGRAFTLTAPLCTALAGWVSGAFWLYLLVGIVLGQLMARSQALRSVEPE